MRKSGLFITEKRLYIFKVLVEMGCLIQSFLWGLIMGSDGQLKYGQLHLTSDGDELGAKPCIEYPYDYDNIDGRDCKTFKFRREANVYNKDATYWGAVAGGRRVAFLDDDYDNGDTHLDWKLIRYVERTDGQWIPIVEGVSTRSNYGYVDTGLSRGSNPDVISMYGSW
jgi:hypothetical protein